MRATPTPVLPLLIAPGLLLASCAIFANPTAETLAKDAAYRARVEVGAFAELPAGTCYYELGGPPTADTDEPLLVLVHGFSVPSFIWDPTFAAAVAGQRPVLRLDLFGRGHSSNPDVVYDVDLFADQVIDLLDHLRVHQPVDLVGLSMGGAVATRAASKRPDRVRKLVLVDSSGFSPDYGDNYDPSPVTARQVAAFQREVMTGWAAGQRADFYQPERFPQWTDRCRPLLRHKGFSRALLSTLRSLRSLEKDHAALQAAAFPVHLVWGRQDLACPFEVAEPLIHARLPRATTHLIDACGHLPQMEQPEIFEALLFDEILNG